MTEKQKERICGRCAEDVLTIEGVSALLRCSVDTVRRISPDDLPVYRVGKCNLYLREEVIRFVRSRRVGRPCVDGLLDDVIEDVEGAIPDVVDLGPVDVRRRSSRRAS